MGTLMHYILQHIYMVRVSNSKSENRLATRNKRNAHADTHIHPPQLVQNFYIFLKLHFENEHLMMNITTTLIYLKEHFYILHLQLCVHVLHVARLFSNTLRLWVTRNSHTHPASTLDCKPLSLPLPPLLTSLPHFNCLRPNNPNNELD